MTTDEALLLGTVGILILTAVLVYFEVRRETGAKVAYWWKRLRNRRFRQAYSVDLGHLFVTPAPGFSGLSIGQVIGYESSNPLVVPFRYRIMGQNITGQFDPIGWQSRDWRWNIQLPCLLLGGAGTGKSVMLYTLLARLINGLRAKRSPIPIFINLREHRLSLDDAGFGTAEWVLHQVREQHGLESTVLKDVVRGGKLLDRWLLILDSLDELMTGVDSRRFDDLLGRFLFRNASVIACRLQFYQRYLSAPQVFYNFTKVELLPWTAADQDEFVERYYTRTLGDAGAPYAAAVKRWCDDLPLRRTLGEVPLRLVMIVDLVSPQSNGLIGIEGKLDLFGEFVEKQLSGRTHIMPVDIKLKLLEWIAWSFFVEDALVSDSPRFTRRELEKEVVRPFCAENPAYNPELVLDDLEENTFLDVSVSRDHPTDRTTLHFVHKSFHSYFAARRVVTAMVGTVDDVASAFSRFLSAEVADFLTEFIGRIKQDQRLWQRAVENMQQAFLMTGEETSVVLHTKRDRRRIAHQQIGYYLGIMTSQSSYQFAVEQLKRESDLWVRRGIAIGLGLGGFREEIDKYVDRLRAERERGVLGANSEALVNLGYHLSFCGDQHVDLHAPDLDQGLPFCQNTVQFLVDMLSQADMRSLHRLCLFTLVDLGNHRPQSQSSFREALATHATRLRHMAEQVSSSEHGKWPEVAELVDLLETVNNGAA